VKKLSFLVFGLLLVSCTDSDKASNVFYHEGEVLKTSKEFIIPRKLKQKIDKDYVDYVRKTDPSNIAPDEELTSQIPRDFLEVDLYLRELFAGSLLQNTVFRTPRGGGLIDLADVVTGDKGSFLVNFVARSPDAPDEKLTNLSVYYLSEVRKKEIDNKVYGTGCHSLVDISRSVKNNITSKGFRVNAKDDRYYYAMAGTYLFVSYALEKIRIAALRVKDTSITGFECPGKS
jgi:hypothetical protein